LSAAEQRHYCPVCNAVFRTPFSRCPLDGNVLAELDGDPLVGTTLDGRYVIEECIGEGGMGRVYRAKHTRMSRTYAIKILFGDHAGDSRMRSRFAREAEAVSRLSHANVISVVDFGETSGGLLYLVMDLAAGESLAELMIREAPMTPKRAVAILAKLAKGLAHAHSQGLVHRDFKGENVIMVTEEEQEVPKIVDFGICMITEDSPSNTMLTSNGMVMGTPAVMAPEQASGDVVDHRTDLFSLGIVGYQMLSGVLPFEGTPLDMARKNLYEPIPAIHERSGVFVAPALEAIITRLTAKQPKERYQNAKDVLRDLQGLELLESGADWGAPTPLPAQISRPVAGGFGDVSSASNGGFSAASSGGFEGSTSNGGFEGSTSYPGSPATPMTTEMVGSSDLSTQRSRKPVVIIGVIIGVIAVAVVAAAAIGFSGGGSNSAPVAANAVTERDAAVDPNGAPPDKALVPNTVPEPTEVEPKEEPDPSGTIKTPDDSETTSVDPEDTSGGQKNTESAQKNSNTRKNTNRKNRQNKNKVKPVVKPPPSGSDTRSLYSSVGRALDRLESGNGKDAVAQLRKDYNAISYSRLLNDSSLQPEYHQKLLRIQRKIRAANKN
tara:strand:- start:46146 stop:47966 length:1821 start_codon:yes stop_codon:yes gene_type:complete